MRRSRLRALALTVLVVLIGGVSASARSAGDAETQTSRVAYVRSVSVSGDTGGPFVGDVYVMDADGSRKENLTRNRVGTEDGTPMWSPDGKAIAYTRALSSSGPAIHLMEADGGAPRLLFRNASSPAWSPDGGRIAFLRGPGTMSQVYVANADGGASRRLTKRGTEDRSPAYSPDGNTIAFVRAGYGPGGDVTAIWSMDADGRRQRRVLFRGDAFAWSPDGKKLAFTRWQRADRYELGLMNPDGTGVRRLGTFEMRSRALSWSPDGLRLAVATEQGIYVMNRTGAARRRITRGKDDHSLSWSPDGRQIVFVRYPNIAVVNADGGPARLLTQSLTGPKRRYTGEYWEPTWSPAK
jgi:Tol biopolymer transport system component